MSEWSLIDRVIASAFPVAAVRRQQARRALRLLGGPSMHYDAATHGPRSENLRASRYDADTDAGFGRRRRLAGVARDLVRNTPFATRAQSVIAANVIGDGIVPKVTDVPLDLRTRGLALIERHFDTTKIDVDGRNNLYGLQRLVMNTVVDSGECLVVRHDVGQRPGLWLPMQLQVLEPEHLDSTRDGTYRDGRRVTEGIQYDPDGVREGYWLYPVHPGALGSRGLTLSMDSVFVPADRVCHVYRQDRPGQMRGVSWFAPVALALDDLGTYADASIMRQKIAACFAAFRRTPEGTGAKTALGETLVPGLIQDIGQEEEIIFGDPPSVSDFDPFTKTVLRSIAAGMGISYESLTGDLSGVNFSSARMGRMEMDRNVSAWQWLMIIPQMMQPIGDWFLSAWMAREPQDIPELMRARIEWVPPHRIIVDPAREIPALKEAVSAGFTTRQGVQRQLGMDPERVLAEQIDDHRKAADAGLVFDSDPALVAAAGGALAGLRAPAGGAAQQRDQEEIEDVTDE